MDAQIELKKEEIKAESLSNIVAYRLPKSKIKLVRLFLKALGVDFKEESYPYGPKFEKDMKEAEEDFKEGRFREIDDVKDLLNFNK